MMQTYHVEHFGSEREPIVVIDGFSGRIDALASAARAANFVPVTGYPGMRSPFDPAYLALGEPLLGELLADHFHLTKRFRAESCSFSAVTVPPANLMPGQRRPHYDAPHSNVVAMVHYTQGPETGGTAFYRHRRTGFETISQDRVRAYDLAVSEDDASFGELPPGYWHGTGERYEMIGEIEARPDRLIAYRGRQLHSGVIMAPPHSGITPADARLTINTFLIGEV